MDKRAALAYSDPTILTEETTASTIEINSKMLTGSLLHEINTRGIEKYYKRKFGTFYEDVLWDKLH
jgi:hypothetical protein